LRLRAWHSAWRPETRSWWTTAGATECSRAAVTYACKFFATQRISDVDRFATGRVIELRGWLDGKAAKELVYTIPVSAGFPAIEGLFSEVKAAYPDVEWYFGNVYDERDGVTPLNWWLA
jgi:hypothetical protein